MTLAAVDAANQRVLDPAVELPGTDWQGLHISPDGGTLAVIHSTWTDERTVKRISALDSSTLSQRWQVEIGRFERSSATGRDTARLSLAPGSQQLFVAVLNDEEMDAIRLSALDLENGERRDEVSIPFDSGLETGIPSTYQGEVFLRIAPDESRLFLTAVVWNTSLGSWREHHASTFSIGLDDAGSFGPATEVVHAPGDERGFFWWDAWLSPRGNVLHGFATQDGRRISGYQFLDLDRDRLTVLDLPFGSLPEREYRQVARILSNDGRRAYLIDTESRETVIINLAEQRLERHFTIDPGDFVSRFGSGSGQLTFGVGHALAHDGTRLYLTAQSADWTRQGDAAHSTGIWVLDLHSWTIVDFIPVQGWVMDFYPLPEASGLVVSNWFYEREGDAQASTSLMRITHHDGHWQTLTIRSGVPKQNMHWSMFSLQAIYRMQHGRTPAVDGLAPADVEGYTTRPRFEVSFAGYIASGVATELEVRVIHPVSGGVLRAPDRGVRFDPESVVMTRLRAEDQPGRIVVLAQIEPGVYRGSVVLPADGSWEADVIVAEPGGRATTASAGLVEVGPTLVDRNGNYYRFQVSTDPQTPEPDEEAVLRLRVVNLESGKRLPQNAELNVELPDRIDVTLANPGLVTGYRTALLYRVSHSDYEAAVTFRQSGEWQATMRLQIPGEQRIEAAVGTIEVLDEP